MATVIERLRKVAWMYDRNESMGEDDHNAVVDHLPAILALAEVAQRIDWDMQVNNDNTVCDTDKANLRSALADLEKEAK